jgi:hypothetical protein
LEVEADELAFVTLSNKEVTLRWLNAFVDEINELQKLVNDGNEEILAAHFKAAAEGRVYWLSARKENNWVEENPVEIEPTSFTDRFLGGYTRKRLGKSSE